MRPSTTPLATATATAPLIDMTDNDEHRSQTKAAAARCIGVYNSTPPAVNPRNKTSTASSHGRGADMAKIAAATIASSSSAKNRTPTTSSDTTRRITPTTNTNNNKASNNHVDQSPPMNILSNMGRTLSSAFNGMRGFFGQ